MSDRRRIEDKRCGATLRRQTFGALGVAILTVASILAAFIGGEGTTSAAEPANDASPRPLAVVSCAGYDAIWEAAKDVAQALKVAEVVETVRAIYGDVQGLDREKPFAVVVATDGSEIVPFAFLPVEKVEKLEFVGASDLKAKLETTPEGIFFGDEPRFRLLEKDGWLFVFEEGKEAWVPTTDPTAWLGDEGAKGVLSVAVDFTAVSEELLEAGFATLRQKIAENAPNDDPVALEEFNATLEYYSALFDSLERARWALSVDAATGDLVWEATVVCKDGSPLAETLAGAQNAETRWGAIAETPNAVWAAVDAGKRSELDREFLAKQQADAVDKMRLAVEIGLGDAEERATAEEFVAVLEKILSSIAADGTVDAASAFACDPLVLTTAIAPIDGEETARVVRMFWNQWNEREPEFAGKIAKFAKIDAETVGGFNVSKIDVPFAEFEERMAPAWTEYWSDKTLAVRWGTSVDAVLLVVGIDSAEADAEFARIVAGAKTKTPAPTRSAFAVAPF
ncbi:MAG: hypothetical protein IJY15_07860, partial [Thermoguttaceae bacterium]|nr:hypothetical protein [Thermoguttaceae bacterium]